MRKVKYKDYVKGQWVEGTGVFHQWGITFEEFESGPAHSTTAIIEDDKSGEVFECAPHHIVFLEPAQQ